MPFDPRAIYDPLDLSRQGFRSARKLDLVFIQDTTGSQTPYIKASVACCKDVCSTLKQSVLLKKDDGLRLGLLAFRDHRDDYIVKDFGGFTDNINTVVSNLNTLTASGGGDGPEAITSALNKALQLDWRDDSVKVAILITDAPPHGIGERGDSYSGGEPGQLDPLHIAQQLASQSIALLIIACEPTLSNGYHFAHDFYMALAQRAGGSMLPLSNIHMLAPLIVGFSLEQIDIDSLASQFEELVLEGHREGMDEEKITNSLLNVMQNKATKVYTLVTIPVYSEPEDADKYVSIWLNASDTLSARNKHKQDNTPKIPRVPEQFITSSGLHSTTRIPITLKNLGDTSITYSYLENGSECRNTLQVNQIGPKPTEFYVHRPYSFTLTSGRYKQQCSRTFMKAGDWDLAQEFHSL